VVGRAHPAALAVQTNIAGSFYALGNLRKAASEYESALALQRASLGEAHPHTITTRENLARVYLALGDPRRALAHAAPAVSAARSGANPMALALVEMVAAGALASLGSIDQALSAARDALAITQRVLPDDRGRAAEAEYSLAQVYWETDRPADALPHAARSLRLLQETAHPDGERLADLLDLIGNLERELGRPRAAIARHEAALRDRGGNSACAWQTLGYLGQAELAAGETEKARLHLGRSLASADDSDPWVRGAIEFALARATHDRAHARDLARAVINMPAARGTRVYRLRAEARQWLQAHQTRVASG
jgi:tetratricopeptide (TPR) repeat protein